MSSLRKILSSRANGMKPMNALRHGLLAETVVLSNESRERFEALLAAYTEKFQPQDEVEADLVEEMVVAKWRQRRLWSMEAAAIDHRIDRQRQQTDKEMEKTDEPTRSALAFTGLESNNKSMSLFLRYEGRMRRGYKHALADFQMMCDIENGPNEPNVRA